MPMQWDVLRAIYQMYDGDEAQVTEFLRRYFDTPVGREEMARGGKGQNVDEFIARLLRAFHDSEGSQ